MKCPEVNSCCFFFSLRTGSAIFGLISLLLSALFAIQSALELFLTSVSDEGKATSSWVLGGDLCIQLIQTVTAIILLLGVFMENCTLLKPWLFTTILVLIAELAFLPSFPGRILIFSEYSWNWTRFFVNLPFIIDDIYGFLVVYNYSCTLSGSHVV